MPLLRLAKPLALYSGLLGLVTVGAVFLVTHSGLDVLLIGGAGLALAFFGLVQAAPPGPNAMGGPGMDLLTEDLGLRPSAYGTLPIRWRLVLYGVGLVGWSLVVLVGFRGALV